MSKLSTVTVKIETLDGGWVPIAQFIGDDGTRAAEWAERLQAGLGQSAPDLRLFDQDDSDLQWEGVVFDAE